MSQIIEVVERYSACGRVNIKISSIYWPAMG